MGVRPSVAALLVLLGVEDSPFDSFWMFGFIVQELLDTFLLVFYGNRSYTFKL